ncbi:hypothetical protein CJ739_2887 [Mariniflexile rhizosphaerae]|uniref:hypothetical protein n=1 Tax=unclassified Mariniflexile TaxID=2643887 RepID=UPI000CA7731B|nr:hypothetical protein [Mariniflexile sp. TRM1-10]AXP81952.1 hypothetical protein CJ739_2887 [Mariniflexile sp. TRM1-10]PLB18025.1 MAG: hypothetical protein TRG1_3113 [Flavobacteriaceae bacterium FS1-H7996/R]
METKQIFEKINFVNRYQSICEKHNDFDNRMRDSTMQLQKGVLDEFGYKYKYISNGSFYQIKDTHNNLSFFLHIVLKGGVVEPLLYIDFLEKTIEPQGRIDFFPEDLGIPFERLKYGLPKYSSKEELNEILKEIFSIYEDLKKEFIKQL